MSVRWTEAGSFVPESKCCVRSRLGELGPGSDVWWPCADTAIDDVRDRLTRHGIPFLERFETRDDLLDWEAHRPPDDVPPPRIINAIILASRGRKAEAAALLTAQAREAKPVHAAFVRTLADKLGVELDELET